MKVRFLIVIQVFTALVVLVVGLLALEEGRRGLLGSAEGPSLSQVYRVLQVMRIYILAGAGVAGVAGIILALGVTRPLLEIRRGVQSISRGNLLVRAGSHREYEVVPLKGAVEKMAATLNDYILKSMTGGAFCLNQSGEITYFSPTAEIIYHEDAWKMVGKKYTEALPLVAANRDVIARIGRCLHKRQGIAGYPALLENADKEQFQVRLTTAMLEAEKEPLLGVVVNLTEPAQVKQLQERLARRDRLASLGFLAAGMAHEIRNPLGSLKGLAQLLQENMEIGDSRKAYIEVMGREVDRLNVCVEKLIHFAEPADDAQTLEDVSRLMSAEVEKLRAAAAARGVALVGEYEKDIPHIPVSSRSLSEALAHLLSYVVEKSPRDSVVSIRGGFTVECDCSGRLLRGAIVMDIRNDDAILTAEERKRLFDPFYGSWASDMGLDLAIVHQIIFQHQGTLDVVAGPEGRMAFRICLPARSVPSDLGARHEA